MRMLLRGAVTMVAVIVSILRIRAFCRAAAQQRHHQRRHNFAHEGAPPTCCSASGAHCSKRLLQLRERAATSYMQCSCSCSSVPLQRSPQALIC